MKSNKFKNILAVLTALITLSPIINITKPAAAANVPSQYKHLRSGHYVDMYGDFYVKITKPTYTYKIHWKSPMALSTVARYKLLKRGQKVHIFQPGANFAWYVWGKGLPNAKYGKWRYTVKRGPQNYSWFKIISAKK